MTLKEREKVYSIEQRKIALQLYDQCKSVIEGLFTTLKSKNN